MSIEDTAHADTAHHELEDSINAAIYALTQSLHNTKQLGYPDASTYTDTAAQHLRVIRARESDLIDWQARQEAA